MKVADVFYHLRKALGLTQQQMAKRLGCSQGLLSKIENGLEPELKIFVAAYRIAVRSEGTVYSYLQFLSFLNGK